MNPEITGGKTLRKRSSAQENAASINPAATIMPHTSAIPPACAAARLGGR